MKRGFFLCDLGDEREPFYSLAVVKTIEGRPAMGRWLGHSSTAVGSTSSGALTSETIPAAAVKAGGTPPSSSSVSDGSARRGDGHALGD
jgi:hypothetical protein